MHTYVSLFLNVHVTGMFQLDLACAKLDLVCSNWYLARMS